ncbi:MULTISPECIES: hypothetical protein [unclassified Lysinibacillus]|uniref:hypothetical protein n=1 Tax=unclassified Lysinibacillus TaxID=2636778 RepID=UPI001D17B680|nr:hypothetical protein [Lysinibacillus sp. CD3-6]UED80613.1 hypothetical protein FH508_0001580 [Lysinibacillus sp. CD3-6]
MKKLFLMIGFFALLIAACSKDVSKTDLEVEDNKESFPPSMTGWLHVDGKKYEMEAGGFQWQRKKGLITETVQTDHASPNQVAENLPALQLEPNTMMQIEIEENPKIIVYLWNKDGREKEVLLNNNEMVAPTSKGRYIYEVFARWSNGEVSYTFVLEVK